MQKYVYTLCFLTGTPLLAGSGIISSSELENLQKQANKSEDTIILQDGTSIKGTLKSIPQLQYSFGSLPINVKDVAIIAFSPKSEKNKIQIITYGGYSYVADLPTENFIVIQYLPNREHPQYTIQKEVDPANIRYVTLKQNDAKYSNPKKRIFDIELKNGDHLPASIVTDSIVLSTGLRDGKIRAEDLLNLEVDFGIHGYTKNKQGQENEFDYTYAKDKFINLQIAQTQQTLGLPWALINKIQRVEPRSSVKLENETAMVETPITPAVESEEQNMLFQQLESTVDRHEEAKQKIQSLQDEIHNHIATRESLQAELQTITDAKAEIEELRTKYEQANQSIQSLQEEIKNQMAVRENLQAELQDASKAKAEMEELRTKYEQANQSIKSLQGEIKNQVAVRANLHTEFQDTSMTEAEMDELRANYEEANQSTQVLQDEIKNLVAVRENLQAELQAASKAKAEMDDLRAKYEQANQNIENLQTELQAASENKAEMKELRAKYEQANQSVESLQNQIEKHITARENLQTELRGVAEVRAEMEELLMQKSEAEGQIRLTYNLEAEFVKTKILENQLDQMSSNYQITDKGTIELVQRYENEVKALQLLLSGKQKKVEFSEKELAETLKEIGRWKEAAQKQSAQTNLNAPSKQTSALQQSLEETQKRFNAAEERSNSLSKIANSLQQTLEDTQVRFKTSEQKSQSLEAEYLRQIAATENLENKYLAHKTELENTIATLRVAHEEVQTQIQEKEAIIHDLTAVKEDLENTISNVRAAHEERQNQLQEKELVISALTTTKEELENTIANVREAHEEGQNQLQEKETTIHALTTAKNELEKTLAQLKEAEQNQIRTIITQDNLEHQIHLISDIDQLTKALEMEQNSYLTHRTDLENTITALREADEEFQKQLQEKETIINNLAAAKEEVDNTITNVRAAHEEGQNQLQEKESVIYALSATKEDLENTITDFRKAHEEGQNQLQEKESVIYALSTTKEDLENTITNFRVAHEEVQKQLQEKETVIHALTSAKEELEITLAQLKEAQQNQIRVLTSQDNHEHQIHLISDIDQLTKALELEQNSVSVTKQNLQQLETMITSLQEALSGAQKQLSEKESDLQTLLAAKTEDEKNHTSQIDSFNDQMVAKHEKIQQLEIELENTLRTELTKRFDYEERIAIMTQTLAEEKSALEQKQWELQQALEKVNSTSQFAESLEHQLQSITQKAVAFGDEFAVTTQKLSEAKTELQELDESNLHLQYLLAESATKFNDGSQQIRDHEEYVIKMTEKAKDQEEYVAKMTEMAKDLEEKLAEKSLELDNLRQSYQSEQNTWAENHAIQDSAYAQKIQELQTALENERNKANHEIEELIAAVSSERELTRELGVQLQRVHATETKFKKQLEQQATKISDAASIIGSLRAENHTYREKLQARYEGIDKLSDEIADLQENTNVVKAFQLELEKIKSEKEQLLQQLQEERDAIADKTALIKGLDAIVKLQKSTLERIERSQMVLKEEK